MRSQTKWGLLFIAAGLVLPVVGFPYTLIYAIPLILIGIGLLVFKRREAIIEERNDEVG
jgi:uncharacterized membrane protein